MVDQQTDLSQNKNRQICHKTRDFEPPKTGPRQDWNAPGSQVVSSFQILNGKQESHLDMLPCMFSQTHRNSSTCDNVP